MEVNTGLWETWALAGSGGVVLAVRTNRLWAVTGIVPGPAVTLVTCPADRTIIVKEICLQNAGGAATDVSVTLRTASATVNVWRGAVASGATVVSTERFTVLEPGDSLELAGLATGSSIRTAGFGAKLLGADST